MGDEVVLCNWCDKPLFEDSDSIMSIGKNNKTVCEDCFVELENYFKSDLAINEDRCKLILAALHAYYYTPNEHKVIPPSDFFSVNQQLEKDLKKIQESF